MKAIKGGITAPKGFLANGIYCGIKKKASASLFEHKKDLSLIFSELPAKALGVFTSNKMQAAPVKVTKKHLKKRCAQAIIANSGNANCFSGAQDEADAVSMARYTAAALNIKAQDVLICSTGVIGRPLEINKIILGLPDLVEGLNTNGSLDAASGIMTTDKGPKELAVRFKAGKNTVTVGGIAKGAGMVSPDMATMLAFITTDANITQPALEKAFKAAVDETFNSITVDGDMSTNDTVLIMANGAAGNKSISTKQKDIFEKFQSALIHVMNYLAEEIVRDGEGATKLVEVTVKGAKSKQDAGIMARLISNSTLVKTAMYGNDPNFGRIIASLGSAGVKIMPEKVDISINKYKVFKKGRPDRGINPEQLKNDLKKDTVTIDVNLNMGSGQAKIKTCDLTIDYVNLNAKYTT